MAAKKIEAIYPLSPLQQGMLFDTLYAPGSGVYVEHLVCRFQNLDIPAFEQAWQRLVDRHTILRTAFVWEKGDEPLQIVGQEVKIKLDQLDWRESAPADQQKRLESYLDADRRQGFKLSKAPLMRLALIRVAETAYQFVWSHHHLLLDGWSASLVMNELFCLYEGFCRGQPPVLEPSLPYQNYIRWLQSRDFSEAEAFWRRALEGFTAPTPLVVMRSMDSQPAEGKPDLAVERNYGEQTRVVSEATTTALQALARQHQLTLNTLVQGAWALLLSRYSGERDVVFGATVSGRPASLPGVEKMLGLFINTLPVRAQVSPQASLLPWLLELQNYLTELRQYEYSPLNQVKKWSDLPPGASLFESILVFENFPIDTTPSQETGQELIVEGVRGIERTSSPLALMAIPGPLLRLRMHYDADRFDTGVIGRMLEHLQTALESMAANPARRLEDVSILTNAERRQLLEEWNNTRTPYPQDVCLHQLIQAQVERTPNATALIFEQTSLTYRELDAHANRLARRLQSLGVGPETLVGICMERSLEMVVGLLAILKAGGAYVPMDPTYPSERLVYMLQDSQVSVLLTQARLLEHLPDCTAQVVCLDRDWDALAALAEHVGAPMSGVTSDNLAYMIYTSGSTGRPKGALNTHRAICNRLFWMQEAYPLTPADRVLQKTPFSFDVSVWEFFWPLLTGACLVIARPEGHKDSAYLVKLIGERKITTLHFVPSMLRVFLQEPGVESCNSLRRVICSGEALPSDLQERFFERLSAELHNLYGPTEAAVDVTYWACQRNSKQPTVPIGRPIANLQIYLLDRYLQPAPVGVPGELHIGGIGLGRGYWNRPELTAEKFIPNPFTLPSLAPSQMGEDQGGSRLYKTGDLARYLPDGSIEFLGRIDYQVKIRGFRVELGEIEAELARHPGVHEAVVLAREMKRTPSGHEPPRPSVPGDHVVQLVAYVIPHAERALSIRQQLRLEKEGQLVKQSLYELPNGMVIAQLNKSETDFTYKEIFDEQTYVQHGITVSEGDCVFDVGANIGLFTLFVGQACKNVTIYAFEPVPPVFELLRINASLYGLNAKLFNQGLANEARTATFTYYPHISIVSGRFADALEEQAVVRSFLLNQQVTGGKAAALTPEEMEALLAEWVRGEQIMCQFKTLSEVMRENSVEHIDLLKIDVEKSELDVLAGIQDNDWPKIRQVVIEVHDVDGHLEKVKSLLACQGYDLKIEQDRALYETGLYNVYAVRPSSRRGSLEGNGHALATSSESAWNSSSRLVGDLRRFLKERLPDYMVPARFVLLDTLPLNPNGKIDRRALSGLSQTSEQTRPDLEADFVAPRTPLEQQLAAIWSQVLGVARVGVHDNFFDLGGDSILSIQIVSRVNQAGLRLMPRQIFAAPTIAQLAPMVEMATTVQAQQGAVVGPVPLLPFQRWFFEQQLPEPHHFNQSVLLTAPAGLETRVLEQVMQALVAHHDALRLRFEHQDGQWQQVNAAPEETVPVTRVDLSEVSGAELASAIEAKANELQASLNLATGPLLRVGYFDLGLERSGRLLMVIHHLAIDGVSWRVLLEDMQTAYEQVSRGEAIRLPAKTTSFKQWAERLAAHAQSGELRAELDYWLAPAYARIAPLPQDYAESADAGANTVASARTITVALGAQETQALLQDVPVAYHTQINEVLLTALAQTLAEWTDSSWVLVDLEGHGREDLFADVDLSRTVGWFTSKFPVLLNLEGLSRPGDLLPSVKEQLRQIPHHGLSYGLLHYLCQDTAIAASLRVLPQAQVVFNYLGQFDQTMGAKDIFDMAAEAHGSDVSLRGRRDQLIDANGFVAGGQLTMNWTYSERLHCQDTVTRLAQRFIEILRELIAHCLSPEAGKLTPADFLLARLTQSQLDYILDAVSHATGRAAKEQVEDIYPLAPMQQGMLFHSLYEPESGMYCEQLTAVLADLNVAEFERAWQHAVDQHPILRSAFVWKGLDEPVQVIRRQAALPLQHLDWREAAPDEVETRLAEYLQADRRRGFDSTRAPLMRLTLIRLPQDAYRLIWSYHHMLLDGWSVPLLLEDVLTAYEAFLQEQVPSLNPRRPYRDYVAWLQHQNLEQAETFWRQRLAGFTSPTPFRVDRLIGAQPITYAEQHLRLPAAQTLALRDMARQQQLTLNTLVQGAWALLLSCYSGETDLVFGATTSGRPATLAGVETMLGLFINTLPVRVRLRPEAPLLDWLRELQDQQLEVRHYEYSSLAQVQRWSEAPGGQPLFESLLVFENYPMDAAFGNQASHLDVREVRAIELTNYPLTLAVVPGRELVLQAAYVEGRFDAVTITRLLKHLQTLLERMAAHPAQQLRDLALLTEAERQQLAAWNATRTAYSQDRYAQSANLCIHPLFEAQVARTPDAVALVLPAGEAEQSGDEHLTYLELNRRANQLARSLQTRGIGPEVRVGLCMERSLDMLIGLLGIVKAGGCYVPLDPAYPPERLAWMLTDAQVAVVVTQQSLSDRFPKHATRLVCLDADWPHIAQESAENTVSGVREDNQVYIIYTSGSTGDPKGVMISHRSLVNYGAASGRHYAIRPDDRLLQFASINFDASAEEIYTSLLLGATLVLRTDTMLSSMALFLQACQRLELTVLDLPTAFWHELVDSLAAEGLLFPGTVRSVIIGGERALPERWATWRQLVGSGAQLINSYGPTETTIVATMCSLTEQVKPEATDPALQRDTSDIPVPIGRPIANAQTYVLDAWLRLAPVGVPGELCVGGVGVARGYLHRPDLTADKFIPDPFSVEPGARLYRTGDRARYRPDGNLEFLGRVDTQVKVRGYRVELGEIEAALNQHPAVRSSAVVVWEGAGASSSQRLAAFVVPNASPSLAVSELRQYLQDRLPDYMVPAAFVTLDAFPLLPNGKVDRRALSGLGRTPGGERPELAKAYIAPQTIMEQQLAAIWEQVLGIERVGMNDNFFELGGHSLSAMQVVSRIQSAVQVSVPIRLIFEHPTLADLAINLEAARRCASGKPILPLYPIARDQTLPLSFAQQRLWFLDQLEPGRATYNMFTAFSLQSELDVAALEQSLSQVARRHEVLRTTFVTRDGQASQVIHPAQPVRMPIIHLPEGPEAEREALRLASEEAGRPFDLARGPLWRVTLLRLGDEAYVLLLAMHHIISDGWSMNVLVREMVTLYEAFTRGQPSPLPELPIQYVDFAYWQRQWLQGQVWETQVEYWKRQLAGAPACLSLPLDYPRPPVQTFRGAQQAFRISQTVTQGLKTLGRQTESSLFTVLLAAFETLLGRYSGQTDIVVGTPVSNRTRSELEGLIGFFVNMLALRGDLSGNPRFRDWVSQARETTLAAQAHQDLPFERLVDELHVERNLSHSPVFQVLLTLQNAERSGVELPGLAWNPLPVDNKTAQFDLVLELAETPEGLSGAFMYNTDLFAAPTIARLAGHWQTLLRSIVENPERRLSELDLLTEAEQQQLLVTWNATQTPYPRERCVHQLFEAQVERAPDAVAVTMADEHLTFRELNARANQLAHHLRALGVEAETRVGLCMDRSLEMVVGLLGILKADGAYVPLDPTYPVERLAFMLADAQPLMMLTQQRVWPDLPAHLAQRLNLDTDWDRIAREPSENLLVSAAPDNLAYVIYTSGSTGQPKGVMISQQALTSHALAMVALFEQEPTPRLLQFISLSFDASAEEIFPALLSGATLVLRDAAAEMMGEQFEQFCERQAIAILHLPVSFWHQWVETLTSSARSVTATLKVLMVGGESPAVSKLQSWTRLAKQPIQFLNAYGPTEATITTTIYRTTCSAEVLADLSGVPIGRPIANRQVYVLDANLQPVCIGVPGELYIGGEGLARGYLGHPELTAAQFIPNPFGRYPGKRLYRTGDLVRWLPDGNLEFLGRIDHQVKVRGFRIELGEIEAVLNRHPRVREAAVIAREDGPDRKRLVAYIVPDDERRTLGETRGQAVKDETLPVEGPSFVSELRSFLKEKLPEYMAPGVFVFLSALPLTPSGKVDRRALSGFSQTAEGERPELAEAYVAPRTMVEQQLAAIWTQVLGVEQVGVHDNFFELGGDSILSIQLVARANQAGLRLIPRQVFQHQTIAELAAAVGTMAAPVQAEQGLVEGAAPLTPIQQWFFEQQPPEPHHFNQSVLLTTPAGWDAARLEQVARELIEHHDVLRMRFKREADGWHQFHAAPDDSPPVTRVDLSAVPEEQLAAAIEAQVAKLQASLNLAAGPVLCVGYLDLGAQRPGRLLLAVHHLVVDGVSWRVLLEDMQAAFEQLGRGEAIYFPPKTTSFKHWAERLTAYAQSEAQQAELDYWLAQPWGQAALLPVDYPEGAREDANVIRSARTVTVALSVEETQALLHQAPQAYNTQVNDILMTALAHVLAEWTGSRYVLVDLEGHGREDLFADVDLSRTVGWFTSKFPVLLNLETARPGKLLQSVKEQLRQIPNRGIGYGVLHYLRQNDPRIVQLRALPAAEVVFNYLGQFDQTLAQDSLFDMAQESQGTESSPWSKRPYLLEVNSQIMGGQLVLGWSYSENVHAPTAIQRLAQEFLVALRALIADCLSPESGGYTPSDFPLARLTQTQLDKVVATVSRATGRLAKSRIEAIYPLSPMQQGLLFHSLQAPESGLYFNQAIFTVHNDFKLQAFVQAWQHVLERHSILRTAFVWEQLDEPVQVVCREAQLPVEQLDWRGLPESQQQERLKAYLADDRRRGFEFSQAPLMRLTLIRLGERSYQCIWSHHHVLMDGWSLPLTIKQVLTLYEAFSRGQAAALEPSRPFGDYIAWLQRQNMSEAEAYWRRVLKGFTAPTSLVVDQATGWEVQADNIYQTQSFQLGASASAALQTFARQHQVTLNTLVQGAWALLLSRYNGESDIVFGATVAGRPATLPGIESVLGLFINTLPVRVRVPPDAILLPWLKELQAQQAELRQYDYCSLVQIQGWSEVPRGQPLFESLLVFENYPVDAAALQQRSETLEIDDFQGIERGNYPLVLIAAPGSQLAIQLYYDSRRFVPETIHRVWGHLRMLLEDMAANPQRRLRDITLLTEAERRQLLTDWNATQMAGPPMTCIHELFETQVERAPERVAVVLNDQHLTYAELNRRANKLAHHLQPLGVGPDARVGICLERSLELVIGMLGTLKAGGAYLPLDPAYPAERLAFMAQDAQTTLLLTTLTLREQLAAVSTPILYMDTDWEAVARASADAPGSEVMADHLSYIIYTSGSTGVPKGTLLTHRGLGNLIMAQRQLFAMRSSSRLLQVASLSFDVATSDIFVTLLSGATLCLASQDTILSGTSLVDVLQDQAVTVMQIPPALLSALPVAPLPALQTISVGGETCPHEVVTRWARGRCFINAYGPSEITNCATAADGWSGEPGLPIGRPIANIQVYILDCNLQPVPIGVPGEVYLGGVGVARGYLNRPDLTAERFIPHPFIPFHLPPLAGGERAGDRLYRTGDLARYLPDGNIEFLGRRDNQIKIRGFRVELGEIEAVLNRHPAVQSAAVIARETAHAAGGKRLEAYFVPRLGPVPGFSDLHDYVKDRLPEYMLPSVFVSLEAMPLSPNGKIDRRALAALDQPQLERAGKYLAPRDTLETRLVSIWEQILKVHPVGVTDNFFELGGHSLLALQLLGQVRKQFWQDLPMSVLLEEPTIERLAQVLREHRHSEGRSSVVPIQASGELTPLFLVPPSTSDILFYRHLDRRLGRKRPIYALQTLNVAWDQEPYPLVEDLAANHIEAMRAIQAEGPYLIGGWSFGGLVALEMAQQIQRQGQAVARLILLDTFMPNDLEEQDDVKMFVRFAPTFNASVSEDELRQLAYEDQMSYFLEQVRQAQPSRAEIEPDQIRRTLNEARALVRIGREYVSQAYSGPAAFFRAEGWAANTPAVDPVLSWKRLVSKSLNVYDIPGRHDTFLQEPNIQVFAKQLQACLDSLSSGEQKPSLFANFLSRFRKQKGK